MEGGLEIITDQIYPEWKEVIKTRLDSMGYLLHDSGRIHVKQPKKDHPKYTGKGEKDPKPEDYYNVAFLGVPVYGGKVIKKEGKDIKLLAAKLAYTELEQFKQYHADLRDFFSNSEYVSPKPPV